MSNNVPEIFLPAEEKELENDLSYVRAKQYELIEIGHKGLVELAEISSQSQHPRAFEVLSGYMKTLSDLNKDLVDTALTKKAQKVPTGQVETKVHNNLFVGSTAELAEMLKMTSKKNNDDEDHGK